MTWSDVDQPPETTRKNSGVAVRTDGILEFLSVSSFREVGRVIVNVIVLVAAHSLQIARM